MDGCHFAGAIIVLLNCFLTMHSTKQNNFEINFVCTHVSVIGINWLEVCNLKIREGFNLKKTFILWNYP